MTYCMLLSLVLGLPGVQVPESQPPKAEQLRPDPGWKAQGRSIWFDPKDRRVILRAKVVLREGFLEHLMCVKGTKEHEAIVSTDAPPRAIHAALILTGAEEGHPVQFVPKFEPPSGTPIAIEMQWRQDGQLRKADARQWVWDDKTKAPLAIDWVFAGSVIYTDEITKKPRYAADDGDLVTVANFASAILDLPMASSANDADRVFSTNTKTIPPLGTEVFVVMSPRRLPAPAKSAKVAKPAL
jgi:hypothetical protein